MPSPFPGMDPYLEGSLWGSVHTQLSVEIARQLTPLVLPRYAVLTERRFIVVMPDTDDAAPRGAASSVYPDAGVAQIGERTEGIAGGVAITAPLRMATVMPEFAPHIT